MNRSEFLQKLKGILESEEGCTTKTTPKKGEGFVPYNRFNIKWGQVDANKRYIRLVFDLKPGTLSEETFAEKTGLTITPPRRIITGYRLTRSQDKDGHDMLIIFLEDSFIENETDKVQAILSYAKEFVEQSSFKTKASR
ncbi:hypothetical protein [Fervidibacillus halotolerans]|uniref:Uncharacterized protein n=1 Tax=Fervidibacillus halotolerans TaxID=2980027 RepID=A0A9E8M0U3_9BACI|nr:hypothetical protein [Fervidibacillus halotolerans]WAA12830.1 hypothetical protein OE105_01410 [Fervidibacillus halotolerans]